MSPTITAAQRNALYDQLLDRLSGIGDIWLAVCAENYDAATRLGRDYSDDLQLVLEGLGWGEGDDEPVELRTPPDVLRRVLPRLSEAGERFSAGQRAQREEVEEVDERTRLVSEACQSVLADLDVADAAG